MTSSGILNLLAASPESLPQLKSFGESPASLSNTSQGAGGVGRVLGPCGWGRGQWGCPCPPTQGPPKPLPAGWGEWITKQQAGRGQEVSVWLIQAGKGPPGREAVEDSKGWCHTAGTAGVKQETDNRQLQLSAL